MATITVQNIPDDLYRRLHAAAGCTGYDTEFVASARDLDTPLVTADRQILRAFPAIVIPLDTFEPEGVA